MSSCFINHYSFYFLKVYCFVVVDLQVKRSQKRRRKGNLVHEHQPWQTPTLKLWWEFPSIFNIRSKINFGFLLFGVGKHKGQGGCLYKGTLTIFYVRRVLRQDEIGPDNKKTLTFEFFFYFFLRHYQKEEIFFTKSVVILLKNRQNMLKLFLFSRHEPASKFFFYFYFLRHLPKTPVGIRRT